LRLKEGIRFQHSVVQNYGAKAQVKPSSRVIELACVPETFGLSHFAQSFISEPHFRYKRTKR